MRSTTRSGKACAMALFVLAACGGRAVDRPGNAAETPASGTSSGGSATTPRGPAAGAGASTGTSSGGAPTEAGAPSDVSPSDAGAGGEAPTPAPHPYRALQIAAGALHSCALLEDHRVKCWGNSAYGALGLGDSKPRGASAAELGDALPFVDLGAGHTAKAIAAGRYSSCAILDDNSAKCWGLDLFTSKRGNIGDDPDEMGDALQPLALGDGRTAKLVAIGHYDACVLLDDDSYFCGGTSDTGTHINAINDAKPLALFATRTVLARYDDGRLLNVSAAGLGLATNSLTVRTASGGEVQHCYLHTDNSLTCVGTGDGPAAMPTSLPDVVDIALTTSPLLKTLCATDSQGSVTCWGDVQGAPWAPNSVGPLEVPLPRPALKLKAGYDFHCALLDDGSVVCWPWANNPTPTAIGNPKSDLSQLSAVDLGTFSGGTQP